ARKPEKIEYEESDLTNYILEYNKCMKYDTDYIAEKETTYFKPGIFVGFSTSHFTTANIEGLTISNADFIASNDLTAGISGNIFFPKSSRYWSMYTAFFYNSLKVNSIVDEPGPGYTIHHEYTFSLQYLKLITAIQYQYNFNSLAPFIYAGFSHAYRLKVEQLHTSQAFYSTGSPGEIHYDTPYNDIYKYEIGYALGIGVLCFDHFAMNIFYNRNYCLSKGGRHFDISSYNVTAAYVF
ncbi:MAG: outer membrane beta-barrel protein, partial [Fimbriimonadaceae bacterium]|nr:outer membrane beta-barrel protein [Chitinophagales bacterium]